MLSRVADSLYWMSRYLERAENTVRQLDVAMSLMLDSGGASAETHWQRLIASLGNPAGLDWTGDPASNAEKLVFDKHHPASVNCCIDAARENARQIREEISTEQWQRLNRLYHQMHSPHTETQFHSNMNDVLSSLIDAVHLFKGVTDTTMIHGQGWHFIRLGRYLERAYAIATLLEVYQPLLSHSPEREHSGYQYLEQVGLLRCCTAFEAYCQVYTADLTPDRILEFLLLNRDFPHAIRYSVEGVRQAIQSIQHTGGRRPPDELTAGIGRLHAMLSFTSISEILGGDAAAFLHTIRQQCMRIHEIMYRYYIQYSIQSALAVNSGSHCMNCYSIRHLTRYRYSHPVSESIMETRMHPRSDSNQHCLTFSLSVSPRCRVFTYRDHFGNNVHHFDIPSDHNQLVIVAESVVEQQPMPDVPGFLSPDAWQALDAMIETGDFWEMLLPSEFVVETPALTLLATQMGVTRRDDPLMLVQELNQRLFDYFEYVPRSTRVDSPIDEAIVNGRGVCQDFAHTMIALLRQVRIPARYVSGYLYRSREDHDRSTPDATHAWVDVLLPHLGWVGFDPTNNLIAHHRHIRTAVGRDYADVPPTHGIFRGKTSSELYVAVHVEASDQPPALDRKLPIPEDWSVLVERAQQPPERPQPLIDLQQMQQQQ